MSITISQLTSADFRAVDTLMKLNKRTLGFLTEEALLESFLDKNGALGAKTDDGQLVGYLLYAAYPEYFRIVQLCVSENFREQGIAKQLLEALKKSATTQKIVRLRCRPDFPANDIWPQLGFTPLDEKSGRSKEGHLLTLWCLTLAKDDQLSLFQANTSDETLDVIIDAQIFFDFYEPDSEKSKPSKALLSDFLVDSLELWITDELFNEIHRNNDPGKRETSRNRAYSFLKVSPEPSVVAKFDKVLRQNFPTNRPSQESDIKQLAKAAASDVNIFVTQDRNILDASKTIANRTGLQVLSPTQLIIQLHELSEKHSYTPKHIAGPGLSWKRMTSEDITSFPHNSFLNHGERKGRFREKLESFLASPNSYECQLLRHENKVVAIRVLSSESDKILTAPLLRLSHSADQEMLFGRFLITDTVSKAIGENLDMVKVDALGLTPRLETDLLEMGFTKCKDNFVKFCFSRCLERTEVLSAIDELCPESTGSHSNMSDLELERHCSPLSLGVDQNYFLIPILLGYAMSLVDIQQSGNDLFGGKTSVLLSWDHVYYRRKNSHKILTPPSRILWYVSKPKSQIVAISHLDEVEIGTPKYLFKKFKKFGILDWNDICKMCDGDISREIMALKFSHTFPFRKPISLNEIRTVCQEDGLNPRNPKLQSPWKIPVERFQKLFRLGYPGRS